jgi:hypothetical protein
MVKMLHENSGDPAFRGMLEARMEDIDKWLESPGIEPPTEPEYVGPDCEHDFAYVFGEGDLRTVECTKCRWVCFAKDRLKQSRR